MLAFARNLEAAIETIHLEQLVREVISFVEKEAELRSIRINITPDPQTPAIESDRGKLQQIFLNIVNNAFAAMQDGGRLDIQVGPAAQGKVAIRICDDGCGIPAEDMHRIFEPFFSTKTGKGGTGLGLSITYNLIQEIGGDIQVTSELDKGSCFVVSLPLAVKPGKE